MVLDPETLMKRKLVHIAIIAACAPFAGCSGSPAAFGITGPGGPGASAAPSTPASADDALVAAPGTPRNFGTDYAPSVAPTYGPDGRYYGYN